MTSPQKWTKQQLQDDAETAIGRFRHERLDEPLALYNQHFTAFSALFSSLIDQIPELKKAKFDAQLIADIMGDDDTRRAFCCLTAPPISEDDLKTLAQASLSPARLLAEPDSARRIRDIAFRIPDPHRFPWLAGDRAPTKEEKKVAIVASAALVAARKVETFRRNDAKDRQEGGVKDTLRGLGFEEIKKCVIPTAAAGPGSGQFMGETPVAGAKADVVAGLPDGRLMIIECKVSNSSVNSYKRIVHDTGGKATIWHREIGRANIVVSAVLNGVFSVANLEHVQNDKDVFLFWDHRLADLEAFVKVTKATTAGRKAR